MASLTQARTESRSAPPIARQKKASPRQAISPGGLMAADRRTARQTLDLQRTAGNQSALAGASTDRFTITLGGQENRNLTAAEALDVLGRHYRRVHSSIEGGYEWHVELMKLQRDQPFVAYFSEALGGVEMPEIDIWDAPREQAAAARRAIKAGQVKEAVDRITAAVDAYEKSYRIFVKYRDGTETGADRAITGLKVTAAAGAVAATIATGGAASAAGASLLGTSAVVGTTAGVYGASQEFAGQASEVYIAETRKDFDVAAILKRGASDAIVGFVGSIVGGALAKQFAKMFGSYLSNISDDSLREIGEALGQKGALPRDFFLTGGQRFIADFLAGTGTTPLTAAVTIAVNRFAGTAGLPSMSEFLHTVVEEMVQGGALQIFIGFITHGKGAHAGGPTPPKPKAPKGKVARGKTAAPGAEPAPMPKAANDNVELPVSAREATPSTKAANDNVEMPGPPGPGTEPAAMPQAANENIEMPLAANDNVEVIGEMKLAAGAEGSTVQQVPQASRRPRSPSSSQASKPEKQSRRVFNEQEVLAAGRAKESLQKQIQEQSTSATLDESALMEIKAERARMQETPPRPRELDQAFEEIGRIKDFDERMAAFDELSERPGLSKEALEYLAWHKRARALRSAEEGAAEAGTVARSQVKDIESGSLPRAARRLSRAAKSIIGRLRANGPNYRHKSKVQYDEILGAKRFEAVTGDGRKLATDHLVPLDTIANLPEVTEFLAVYEKVPSSKKPAMEQELIDIGDRENNLFRMRADANGSSLKSNKSWYEVDPAKAREFGYERADVDRMRNLEAERLAEIKKAIKAITDKYRP